MRITQTIAILLITISLISPACASPTTIPQQPISTPTPATLPSPSQTPTPSPAQTSPSTPVVIPPPEPSQTPIPSETPTPVTVETPIGTKLYKSVGQGDTWEITLNSFHWDGLKVTVNLSITSRAQFTRFLPCYFFIYDSWGNYIDPNGVTGDKWVFFRDAFSPPDPQHIFYPGDTKSASFTYTVFPRSGNVTLRAWEHEPATGTWTDLFALGSAK